MPEGHEGAVVRLEAPPDALGYLWDGRPAIALLNAFLGQLIDRAGIRAVVAIGSRARGDWRPWSDIDIILICDKDIRPYIPGLNDIGIVDVRPYTPDELIRGIMRCDVELLEGFEEGLVLYDDGVWRGAREVYERVKALLGIERHGPGWRIRRKMPLDELSRALGLAPQEGREE